jgi:diguanylate cyclase (GGDEF)-like protein
MRLSSQLIIGLSLGFLLLLLGLQGIYLVNARNYLQEQLGSHAQDSATSLSLLLADPLAANDMVLVEVSLSAVFDRGYFRRIAVLAANHQILLQKELPPAPPGVPAWFARVFPLDAPSAEALVSKGWLQLGRVVVTSHPNFAYLQLWNTTWESFAWMFGLYLVAMALLLLFLRTVLRPLQGIERVARAIAARDFQTVSERPRARELASVVRAMNAMSRKIRDALEAHVSEARRLRREAYSDELTGVDNRRAFEEQLRVRIDGAIDPQPGALYLFELTEFKQFNTRAGYKAGDEILRVLGKALLELFPEGHQVVRARLGGATFGILAATTGRDEATRVGSEIKRALELVLREEQVAEALTLRIGGAYFESHLSQSQLMSKADLAMLQSGERPSEAFLLLDCGDDERDEQGSQYWKTLIVAALEEQRLALVGQPVFSLPGKQRIQFEVMGRLRSSTGELISAARFMPMAARHNLTTSIDRKLIETVLAALAPGQRLAGQVAVNLAVRSLQDAAFLAWFESAMRGAGRLANQIVFEVAEFALVRDLAAVERFAALARVYGAGLAVDNFGLHRQAFEYLLRLKPAYIKLDRGCLHQLREDPQQRFFVSSVVHIAKTLDIEVLALGVEDEATVSELASLGVNGYQGFIAGPPQEV